MDLIERQAAIDFINAGHLVNPNEPRWSDNEVVNFLKSRPPAQPEIVRCKDCKYWDKTWTNDWVKDYHYCPNVDGVRKVDFYCADAERRTDEQIRGFEL